MRVTRVNILTGKVNSLELNVTEEQLLRYEKRTELVQNIFPNLSKEEREFLITGMLPDHQKEFYGEEEYDLKKVIGEFLTTDKLEELNLQGVIGFLPEKTALIFVNYTDSLDNNLQVIQDCIESNSLDSINDHIESWYLDSYDRAISEYLKDLKRNIATFYGLEKEEAKAFIDDNYDAITDEIHSRCIDTVALDLLRNTNKEPVYFDTGYEVPSESWSWDEKTMQKEIKSICKVLNIKTLEPKLQDLMKVLIGQATSGGKLVVYFRTDWRDLFSQQEDFTSISFKNPCVAIIDTHGGSGDYQHFDGIEILLPFNRENLSIDRLDKYSFVHEVCGLVLDFADDSKVTFGHDNTNQEVLPSSSKKDRDVQKEYQKTFNEGSCTAGDMNITRHRKVTYENQYPCGNRCSDCNTFWID